MDLKRIGVGVLVVAVLNLQVPVGVFAADISTLSKSTTITEHPPEMLATPELNIPKEQLVEKKSSKIWFWGLLGAVLAAAVAGGGGGGGGGGGKSGGGGNGGGTVSTGW